MSNVAIYEEEEIKESESVQNPLVVAISMGKKYLNERPENIFENNA